MGPGCQSKVVYPGFVGGNISAIDFREISGAFRFCVGFPTQSQRQRYLFLTLFIYLSTDRSARHVVSSLGVST